MTFFDQRGQRIVSQINTVLQLSNSPSLKEKRQKINRERMLSRVRRFWVNGVLERSLHGFALIALGLHEQPDLVENPWQLIMQEARQPAHLLPQGTRIISVYDETDGSLLILGEPGSGKTTLLLELTRDLLDRATKDDAHPIPVVFNLSSWAEKRYSIADWLVEELNSKYQIPSKVAQLWIDEDFIVPLLDGLDEVNLPYRPSCIKSINIYRKDHNNPLVICSRKKEYLKQNLKINVNSAVSIQSLTIEQIDDYLQGNNESLETLKIAIHADKALQELAAIPLMLDVLAIAYAQKSVQDIMSLDTSKNLRQQIFDIYIQRVLERRGMKSFYTQQQIKSWLAWLAIQMTNHNQTIFYIEHMQFSWITSQRNFHFIRILFHILAFGLLGAIISGLYNSLFFGFNKLEFGVLMGSIIGMQVSAILSQVKDEIKPADFVILPSFKKLLEGILVFIVGTSLVIYFAPTMGKITGLLFNNLTAGTEYSKSLVTSIGAFPGLLMIMMQDFEPKTIPDDKLRSKPNQGIQRSFVNGIRGMLTGGLMALVGGRVLNAPTSTWINLMVFACLFGAVYQGGTVYIQHFVLRILLWINKSMPYNYVRFLDFATERILLNKIGGGYQFVHRLLQDHFTEMYSSHALHHNAKFMEYISSPHQAKSENHNTQKASSRSKKRNLS